MSSLGQHVCLVIVGLVVRDFCVVYKPIHCTMNVCEMIFVLFDAKLIEQCVFCIFHLALFIAPYSLNFITLTFNKMFSLGKFG